MQVRPLVEDVCRQAKLLAPERAVICDDVRDVAVLGDQDALRQVLLILMDNALKHTAGAITVAAEAAHEQVEIRVRDAGPGIKPEELGRVFELRVDSPIAKALMEAQGGAIAVESQPERGSVFTVTLPRASSA